jgi:hypothetical protein
MTDPNCLYCEWMHERRCIGDGRCKDGADRYVSFKREM